MFNFIGKGMKRKSKSKDYIRKDQADAIRLLAKQRLIEAQQDNRTKRLIYDRHMRAVDYVSTILDDVRYKLPKAIALAQLILREAERRNLLQSMEQALFQSTLGDDVQMLLADSQLALSRVDNHVVDRLRMAMLASHEFFDSDLMDLNDSIDDILD